MISKQIKKIIGFSFIMMMFALNVHCMDNEGLQTPSTAKCNNYAYFTKPVNWMPYLLELSYIYSLDSTNEKVIRRLAGTRIFFSGLSLIVRGILLGAEKKIREKMGEDAPPSLNWKGRSHLLSKICRDGYFIAQDYKILNRSSVLKTKNEARQNSESLKNKKLVHYIWTTLNFALPGVVSLITKEGKKVFYADCAIDISETYRKYLMYRLLMNKS